MDQQIAKIVREIAQQTFHEHAGYYVVLLLFLFLSTAAAGYLGSYFQARGQRAATDADLQKILDQLEKTTALTKEIELSLSRADWTAKERISLRRDRLERAVLAVNEMDEWLNQLLSIEVFGEGDATIMPSPRAEFRSLLMLYFPELDSHRITIDVAIGAIIQRVSKARIDLIPLINEANIAKASKDADSHKNALDKRLETVRVASTEIFQLRTSLNEALRVFLDDCKEVMHEMMEIRRPTPVT